MIKATLKVFGRTYTASGDTALEAIKNIPIKNVKGRSVLVLEQGDKKKERILQPAVTFRLFNTAGLSREVALKNASLLFGDL